MGNQPETSAGEVLSVKKDSSGSLMAFYPVLVLWIASSVVATGLLVTGDLFRLPLHLLLAHLAVALVFQACSWLHYRLIRRGSQQESTWSLDISSLILTGLSVALLLNGYKAIALSNDLPNLILILTLDWHPVWLIDRIRLGKHRAWDVGRYVTFFAGLYLVCVFNFRLRSNPLKMALKFLAFSGLAQVVWHWEILMRKPFLKHAAGKRQGWPWHSTWVSLVVVVMLVQRTEPITKDRSPLSRLDVAIVVISTVLTASLFAFGTSNRGETTQDEDFLEDDSLESSRRMQWCVFRLAVAGYVCALHSLLSPRPGIVSFWQILGYILAVFAFTTWQDLAHYRQTLKNALPTDKTDWMLSDLEERGAILVLFMAVVFWLSFGLLAIAQMPPPLLYTDLALNSAPAPASGLDIVFARYAEDTTELAQTIDSILAHVGDVKSRVVIYNKNDDGADFEKDLQTAMSSSVEIVFENLPNIGREADTFLHHIVEHWDSLATHTLFAQAEVDDLPLMLDSMDHFFVPETGFLQLSYVGNWCASCEHCGDWSDDPAVMSDLFAMTNQGKACHDLVFTFRGQFVVSGARIRANEKSVYEYLLQQLRDPESVMHSTNYTENPYHLGMYGDSLNNPTFGFLLERFWGILFQCSEPRIAHWSPSQFAVYMRPSWLGGLFPLDYVQCLDRSVGEGETGR